MSGCGSRARLQDKRAPSQLKSGLRNCGAEKLPTQAIQRARDKGKLDPLPGAAQVNELFARSHNGSNDPAPASHADSCRARCTNKKESKL